MQDLIDNPAAMSKKDIDAVKTWGKFCNIIGGFW